ncbi:2-dehydropantoate 2-reductase [Loigolactobacillus backii]|uniref:ketopantoate reductase family protein n=1 Tax=Loigolactobacillus backii TaxID=375175 RepID=UPI0007F15140|nr:ketopantoate reductase family protein [Loigolactobacillus backii]ANK65696.1 2-dehydropantoate 2-reductase [Loigolactobacillus backii]
MKYTIIGAGAMGYRYGVLLQENAGVDVDFIDTWQPNVEKVREQGGVTVSRNHQNRHIVPINIYYPEEYQGKPDVWIVFMKQMQLADMLKRCAPLFNDHQIVFSAMNGMGHIDKLRNYFNDNQIIGGTAMIATVLNGPADVDFMGESGAGEMHMANYTEEINDNIKAVEKDFKAANLNPIITTNFMGTLMSKVVFNAVVNTLCTMFELTMGQFIEYPGAKEMSTQLMNESYDACERAGIQMIETRQQEIESVDYVSRVSNPLHYPSMYQDFSKGRPTEVDYINGYIAKIGREHDYICRTHEFITHEVHLAEMMRKYKQAPAKQMATEENSIA